MLEAGCRSVVAVFFLVLACISGPSAEIAAQDTPTVAVGERVRVSTESGATHVGLLSAMTSGALEVQGEGVICPPETRPSRVLDFGRSKPGEGGQNGSTEEGNSGPDHQPSP